MPWGPQGGLPFTDAFPQLDEFNERFVGFIDPRGVSSRPNRWYDRRPMGTSQARWMEDLNDRMYARDLRYREQLRQRTRAAAETRRRNIDLRRQVRLDHIESQRASTPEVRRFVLDHPDQAEAALLAWAEQGRFEEELDLEGEYGNSDIDVDVEEESGEEGEEETESGSEEESEE